MTLPVDPETPPTPPGNVTPPTPSDPVLPTSIRCDFCDCRISHRGEVLEMSPKAKKLVKQDMTIDDLSATVTRLEGELARVKPSEQEPTKRGRLFGT